MLALSVLLAFSLVYLSVAASIYNNNNNNNSIRSSTTTKITNNTTTTSTAPSTNTSTSANDIIVTYTGGYSCSLLYKNKTYRCALGKNGVNIDKKEGDGTTPLGRFPLRQVFYREDRIGNPTFLPAFTNRTITLSNYGWCDDSSSIYYNQFVYLPFSPSHEDLYLSSDVYDIFAVVGYNDAPIVPYKGSAIFFHVTSSYGGTAGCIAMGIDDLVEVLGGLEENSYIVIQQ